MLPQPATRVHGDVERGTYRKYNTSLQFFVSFCCGGGIVDPDAVGDSLEEYRRSRKIRAITWKVERQTLVTFFAYCLRRKWIAYNPAKELPAPRGLKPNEVVPYSLAEEVRILAACERIGGGKYNRSGARYEQLRARAMILILRNTALTDDQLKWIIAEDERAELMLSPAEIEAARLAVFGELVPCEEVTICDDCQ